MEHCNATFSKYARVFHYIRETLAEFRGDKGVQRFENLHMLTQRKPIKGLTTGNFLNDGRSRIAGNRQESFPTGAHKSIYIIAAFLHYAKPRSSQDTNVSRYGQVSSKPLREFGS